MRCDVNYIKQMRESKKILQKDVAVFCGVSRSLVAHWETGRSSPPIDVLIKLSDLFGCTIDELVRGGVKK